MASSNHGHRGPHRQRFARLVLLLSAATGLCALAVAMLVTTAPGEDTAIAANRPLRPMPPPPPPPMPRPVAAVACETAPALSWAVVHDGTRRGFYCGGDCRGPATRGTEWKHAGPIPWQAFGPGEYIGPPRTAHVDQYHLRVDDLLEFVYRVTRDETSTPYKFNVGDTIRIESLNVDAFKTRDNNNGGINPELLDNVVLSDGTISLHLIGRVRVTGFTADQLRATLIERYKKWYKEPDITVTPVRVNTKLEDLRATVDSRFGAGGQGRQARVTPEGTIALPAVDDVFVQGLTLRELKRELNARYAAVVEGVEVTPVLVSRAPRFIYVLGEVRQPGRYELTGPTTVMQAIALAGGWNVGSHLWHTVVFRRDENWQLMATLINIRGAVYGRDPCPADEIWLRDTDIIVVPKHPILQADEFIELVFTRGIYGVLPNQGLSFNFSKLGTL